jgi:hypothetical protein
MATITRTYTRTHNAVNFADPYKQCLKCGGWVDGFLRPPGPSIVTPCEHQSDYKDVCPSWGPVDGCTCAERGWTHPMRTPTPGDGKVY